MMALVGRGDYAVEIITLMTTTPDEHWCGEDHGFDLKHRRPDCRWWAESKAKLKKCKLHFRVCFHQTLDDDSLEIRWLIVPGFCRRTMEESAFPVGRKHTYLTDRVSEHVVPQASLHGIRLLIQRRRAHNQLERRCRVDRHSHWRRLGRLGCRFYRPEAACAYFLRTPSPRCYFGGIILRSTDGYTKSS